LPVPFGYTIGLTSERVQHVTAMTPETGVINRGYDFSRGFSALANRRVKAFGVIHGFIFWKFANGSHQALGWWRVS